MIPKSADPKRMKENLDVRHVFPVIITSAHVFLEIFTLSHADIAAISSLHEQPGKLRNLCDHGQGDIQKTGKLFGWSLAEMGWDQLDWGGRDSD